MNDLYPSPFVFLVGLLLALIGIGAIMPWLKSRQIFDQPNERSSHIQPTTKGAGLVMVGSIIIMFLLIDLGLEKFNFSENKPITIYLLIALILLALVSWLDDLQGLSITVRLLTQLIIIATILVIDQGRVNFLPTFMPWWIWFLPLLTLWCWFTNIFNFMDGIDGISGVESISICLGIVILAAANGWIFLGVE